MGHSEEQGKHKTIAPQLGAHRTENIYFALGCRSRQSWRQRKPRGGTRGLLTVRPVLQTHSGCSTTACWYLLNAITLFLYNIIQHSLFWGDGGDVGLK